MSSVQACNVFKATPSFTYNALCSISYLQPGQLVKARVIGFRLVDGLATLSMKKAVLDQEVGTARELDRNTIL